ncbi:hypothetical protein GCG54_00009439 [Colletotrichum gloeosporioides]|uniref:DUF427 domain-containing protein n=1 Tax=Colletotrichum gloeosporioides TaxID=474922 RepID=A0A8H4C573_COLGL|nr:uncharacterized protein GCG54_00009439 [Colletotrichum gloeosporioides]KAF3797640.1 hypothetical protein GCG54_00009439 [Colletotrichum gloeosporioides]
MAAKPMNVQSFPRPPLLEKVSKHLRITWHGEMIADTKNAYWVLETHHPPSVFSYATITILRIVTDSRTAYYLPSTSINVSLTPTRRSTYCEWKGAATYYAITAPGTSNAQEPQVVSNRIWSYDSPSPGFEAIKGYLSFYAGPWDCFVDGELVEPQPGDFYGGWVTSDIEGIVKGAHGNWDPVL